MPSQYVVMRGEEGWTLKHDGTCSKTYPTRQNAIEDAIRRAIADGDCQILVRD